MKTIILGLCATFVAGAAHAQSTDWDSCTDPTKSVPYSRCALLLADGQLLRGRPLELVTIEDAPSPIKLRRYVRGEPARQFAIKYERETRTALLLRYTGAALILTEGWTGHGLRDGKATRVETRVVKMGLGLMASSFPFRWMAMRDGDRAVEAHNAGLVRE
jgi:hypothetical protein